LRFDDPLPAVSLDIIQIQQLFVTTKDKGMGIGLAVSRSIAEAHGGRLWAEKNPDGGARFSVALPLSPVNGDPTKV
jgi:signal transduction histidine kinase